MSYESKINVGIDLGTTNSECFVDTGDGPLESIPFKEGNRYKPGMLASVVRYEDGDFTVGNSLKEDEYLYETSWKCLKVNMKDNGTYGTDGKQSNKQFPQSITPVEFSKQILKTILRNIQDRFPDSEIDNLIITVPAYFKDNERRNVIEAARGAGFNPKGEFTLINEPTAAALAYGESLDDDQKVVAFDLGGGTFDVTLLEYENIDGFKFYQAIATDGKEIGGKNFDEKIVDIIYEKYISTEGAEHKGDKSFKNDFYRTFMLEAEKIKISLNNLDEVSGYKMINHDGERCLIQYSISADEFYSGIKSMVADIIQMTRNVIGANKVDKLIFVGGSTRMPYIKEQVKKAFPDLETVGDDPDLIVAKGAAIHAKTIGQKEDSSMMLNEITSNGVGVSVVGHFVATLIHPNTPIPCTISQRFYGVVENQDSLSMYVVTGNSVFVESPDNQIIGKVEMNDLKKTGERPAFDITLSINKDSTVDIVAKEAAADGQEVFKRFSVSDNVKEENEENLSLMKEGSKKMFKDVTNEKLFNDARELVKELGASNDPITVACVEEIRVAVSKRNAEKLKLVLFRYFLNKR